MVAKPGPLAVFGVRVVSLHSPNWTPVTGIISSVGDYTAFPTKTIHHIDTHRSRLLDLTELELCHEGVSSGTNASTTYCTGGGSFVTSNATSRRLTAGIRTSSPVRLGSGRVNITFLRSAETQTTILPVATGLPTTTHRQLTESSNPLICPRMLEVCKRNITNVTETNVELTRGLSASMAASRRCSTFLSQCDRTLGQTRSGLSTCHQNHLTCQASLSNLTTINDNTTQELRSTQLELMQVREQLPVPTRTPSQVPTVTPTMTPTTSPTKPPSVTPTRPPTKVPTMMHLVSFLGSVRTDPAYSFSLPRTRILDFKVFV